MVKFNVYSNLKRLFAFQLCISIGLLSPKIVTAHDGDAFISPKNTNEPEVDLDWINLPDSEARKKTLELIGSANLNIPEELEDMKRSAIELNAIVDIDPTQVAKDLSRFSYYGIENRDYIFLRRLQVNALISGHKTALTRELEKIIQRLYQPGDPELKFYLALSSAPSLHTDTKAGIMYINLGVLGYANNFDEVAAFIAPQIETYKIWKERLITGKTTQTQHVNSYVDSLDLTTEQKDSVTADLRAVERLINAGYNPFGLYNIHKRLSKYYSSFWWDRLMINIKRALFSQTDGFESTKATLSIRTSAVKGYIAWQQEQRDLFDLVSRYEKFKLSWKLLNYRLKIYQLDSANFMFKRIRFYIQPFIVLVSTYVSVKAAWRYYDNFISASDNDLDEYKEWQVILSEEYLKLISSLPEQIQEPLILIHNGVGWLNEKATPIIAMGILSSVVFLILYFLRAVYVEEINLDPVMKKKLDDNKKRAKLLAQLISQPQSAEYKNYVVPIKAIVTSLNTIDLLYKKAPNLRGFKFLDGLVYNRLKLTYQLVELLKRLKNAPEDIKKIALQDLESLPPFILDGSISWPLLQEFYFENKNLHTIKRIELVAEAKRDNIPIARLVELVVLLVELGQIDSARRIYNKNSTQIINWVFSSQNPDSRWALKIEKVIQTFKDMKSLKPSTLFARLSTEHSLVHNLNRNINLPVKDSLGLFAMQKKVPRGFFRWIRQRYYLDKRYENQFQSFFREFSTVRELHEFIKSEIVSRNVNINNLAEYFNLHLSLHPEMIKTKDDILLVFQNDYFWPTGHGQLNNLFGIDLILARLLDELKSKFPKVWKYDPISAERLHAVLLKKIHEVMWQDTFEFRKWVWLSLSSRGVTSTSDLLFLDLLSEADNTQRIELEQIALSEGRIWEPTVKADIAKRNLFNSLAFMKLKTSKSDDERKALIYELQASLLQSLPEKGIYFEEILEELSVKILSSREESRLIHGLKNNSIKSDTDKSQELGLRVASDILQEVLAWPKYQQWNFLMFILGKASANKKIESTFKVMGSERIKRTFQLMPLAQKVQFLDSLLDSPSGLMPKGSVNKGFGKKIVDYLLDGKDETTSKITRDILKTFFQALEDLGNKGLGTYLMSYVLSLPPSEMSSAGHVLKNCLEVMGLTGVKLAQFLAASEILSKEDTEILRGSQERALEPKREEIYSDFDEILLNTPKRFKLLQVLGSASLKYTLLAIDESTGKHFVLKVFRKSAFTKARQQFAVLESMAEQLIKLDPDKYSIVRTVVKASISAVKKELSSSSEYLKSQIARVKLYDGKKIGNVVFKAPREVFVHDRLIAAEFMIGTSIFDKETLTEIDRNEIAKAILILEKQILFSENNEVVFEPDRHAGNFRVRKLEDGQLSVGAIDFGQISRTTKQTRDHIIELFAYAQVLEKAPNSQVILENISNIFQLTDSQKKKLSSRLYTSFGNGKTSELGSYFKLLSVIEDSGKDIGSIYLDYIRAIIQLKQYEKFIIDPAEKDSHSVIQHFSKQVEQIAQGIGESVKLQLSFKDKVLIGWKQILSGSFSLSQAIKLIQGEDLSPNEPEVSSKPKIMVQAVPDELSQNSCGLFLK